MKLQSVIHIEIIIHKQYLFSCTSSKAWEIYSIRFQQNKHCDFVFIYLEYGRSFSVCCVKETTDSKDG